MLYDLLNILFWLRSTAATQGKGRPSRLLFKPTKPTNGPPSLSKLTCRSLSCGLACPCHLSGYGSNPRYRAINPALWTSVPWRSKPTLTASWMIWQPHFYELSSLSLKQPPLFRCGGTVAPWPHWIPALRRLQAYLLSPGLRMRTTTFCQPDMQLLSSLRKAGAVSPRQQGGIAFNSLKPLSRLSEVHGTLTSSVRHTRSFTAL